MAQRFGTVYLEVSSKFDGLINGVNQANKSLGLLERTANRVSTTFQGILIGRGVFELIQGLGSAVTTIADFDKAMTQVRVITGATGEDFSKLEQSALQLGSSTQYTAKQVADLQLEFGRLGFSTKEILQSTKATVDLATATGEGLARSAEIAGSTLRAFGLDAKEMSRVTDVMASSLNESALTLDSFAEGIKYVAPVAAASNVSLEETAAMLSVLADAGIKGSQAGTSLRRIFTQLTDDGKPLQERLNELSKAGITLAAANDEVGLYAQTALLILGRYKPRIDELTQAYKEAVGSTNEMARAMEDNLATSITKVGTAWDALILSLKGSKGILKESADSLSLILRGLATSEVGLGTKIAALYAGPQTLIQLGKVAEIASKKAQNEQEKLNNLIEDSALTLLKDYGNNLQGVKDALLDNANSQEIYKRYLELATKAENDQIIALAENTRKQIENNEAKQDAIKLAYELSEIQREARIATLERKQAGERLLGIEQFAKQFGGTQIAMPDNAINSMKQALQGLSETYGLADDLGKSFWEAEQQRIEQTINQWSRFGMTVGHTLANIIAYDEDFKTSAKKVAADVLRSNAQQISSYLGIAAAKAIARNPGPVGIGIATAVVAAGIGIVSGLLGKDWKQRNARSSPSYSYSSLGSRTSNVNVTGKIVADGKQLAVVLTNQTRINTRTKGN